MLELQSCLPGDTKCVKTGEVIEPLQLDLPEDAASFKQIKKKLNKIKTHLYACMQCSFVDLVWPPWVLWCPRCSLAFHFSTTSGTSLSFESCIVESNVWRYTVRYSVLYKMTEKPRSVHVKSRTLGQSAGSPFELRLTCTNRRFWKIETEGYISLLSQTAWSEASSGLPLFE